MTTDAATSLSPTQQTWGKVVMAGGTDWPNLGKSKVTPSAEHRPDLLTPHILRSLSNVKVTSIHSSSASDHVVCIDVNGHAFLFGRNASSALGPSSTTETFISEKKPKHISPATFGNPDPAAKFVFAVLGKNMTILIDSEGGAWAAGDNKVGQCGLSTAHTEIKVFTKISVPQDAKIVSGSAGVGFSLLLSQDGRVFSFGSAEHGQLGHGRTGETIVSAGKTGFDVSWSPKIVRGALEGKKIVQVASGHSHSLALDADGLVFTWGYGGYCRMGLLDQKDRLFPVVVPQFAQERINSRAKYIACGASDSTVIDNSGTFFIAGKFKTTGPGSGGAPYTTFKYLGDLMGLKATKAVGGTGAHVVLCDEVDEQCLDATLSAGFGQGTNNGELGFGEDEIKSATKPTKILPLHGLKIIDVAAGAHSTYFLVVPSDLYAELPRHPDVEPTDAAGSIAGDAVGESDSGLDELCTVCHTEKVDGEGNVEGPLACDVCDKAFHIACLSPPLETFPEDPEWFCASCEVPGKPERSQTAGGAKRKGEEGDEGGNGAKRIK